MGVHSHLGRPAQERVCLHGGMHTCLQRTRRRLRHRSQGAVRTVNDRRRGGQGERHDHAQSHWTYKQEASPGPSTDTSVFGRRCPHKGGVHHSLSTCLQPTRRRLRHRSQGAVRTVNDRRRGGQGERHDHAQSHWTHRPEASPGPGTDTSVSGRCCPHKGGVHHSLSPRPWQATPPRRDRQSNEHTTMERLSMTPAPRARRSRRARGPGVYPWPSPGSTPHGAGDSSRPLPREPWVRVTQTCTSGAAGGAGRRERGTCQCMKCQ